MADSGSMNKEKIMAEVKGLICAECGKDSWPCNNDPRPDGGHEVGSPLAILWKTQNYGPRALCHPCYDKVMTTFKD